MQAHEGEEPAGRRYMWVVAQRMRGQYGIKVTETQHMFLRDIHLPPGTLNTAYGERHMSEGSVGFYSPYSLDAFQRYSIPFP